MVARRAATRGATATATPGPRGPALRSGPTNASRAPAGPNKAATIQDDRHACPEASTAAVHRQARGNCALHGLLPCVHSPETVTAEQMLGTLTDQRDEIHNKIADLRATGDRLDIVITQSRNHFGTAVRQP